ncbi:MAG: TIGR02266 family protein [bacterium]
MASSRKKDSGGLVSRREYPRVPVQVEVKYTDGTDFVNDYMLNVSRGGIYVTCENPLKVGSEVDLVFSLPAFNHVFRVKGMVVWNRPVGKFEHDPGMGIQFLDMEDEDLAILDSFVRIHRMEI